VSSEQPILSGVAGRYASALFELALDVETGKGDGLETLAAEVAELGAVNTVEADLASLQTFLNDSEDLRRLVRSPVFGRADQTKAMTAIVEKAGFSAITRNFISLVAANGRLLALEDMLRAFRAMVANHRGEVSATVTSAVVLKDEHVEALKASLKETLGRDVTLDLKVDESLIAGLVVKVGSRMIDSSLKTKLTNLKIAMKEVG
jgi:F-type H+-transporting ATPase subunit delta